MEKGRTYRQKHRIVIQVFSKNQTLLDRIKSDWGGNYYSHKVGWVWIQGAQKKLVELRELLDELQLGRGKLKLLDEVTYGQDVDRRA